MWLLTCCLMMAGADPCPEPEPSDSAPAEPRLLMRLWQGTPVGCWLDERGLAISGWTNASFTASTAAPNQNPYGFNYLANEFLLQQNWLRIEKPIDAKAATPTIGFRSDTILPGTDYRYTIARGLWDNQLTDNNGGPQRYGIDPVQFYGEVHLPGVFDGLNWKVGRFFAQYGAENIDATLNALPSRSYTFIYNPFTHTGLLSTVSFDKNWSGQAGLVTGCDVFFDTPAAPCYIGSVKWAPPDGPTSAQFSVILGRNQYDDDQMFHNPHVFDVTVISKWNDQWTYTLEALYGYTLGVPSVGFANWFGVVQYLTRKYSDQWSHTTRLEFFDDVQGQRTGYSGLYSAIATGWSWRPTSAWVVRPELRFDHNQSRPFSGDASLFTATFDAIFNW